MSDLNKVWADIHKKHLIISDILRDPISLSSVSKLKKLSLEIQQKSGILIDCLTKESEGSPLKYFDATSHLSPDIAPSLSFGPVLNEIKFPKIPVYLPKNDVIVGDISNDELFYSELPTGYTSNTVSARLSSNRICLICGETDTPEWRRGPEGKNTLCNACGVSFAQKLRLYIISLENKGNHPTLVSQLIPQYYPQITAEVYRERLIHKHNK